MTIIKSRLNALGLTDIRIATNNGKGLKVHALQTLEFDSLAYELEGKDIAECFAKLIECAEVFEQDVPHIK
jgi:hypothetical protein